MVSSCTRHVQTSIVRRNTVSAHRHGSTLSLDPICRCSIGRNCLHDIPSRRFRYHGGRGSSDPVFGTISVIIFIGLCVWNVYNRRRRSRIAQGRLQQNPPAYGGPAGPQYGAVAPTYNGGVPSGAQAMPYQPNGGGTSTMPNTGYGYGGAPGQQGYYPPQQGGQGYGQYPPTYR